MPPLPASMRNAYQAAFQHNDSRIRTLYQTVRELAERTDERFDAAAEVALRIVVVAEVEDLPDEAKPTEWFRVTATPAAVYVGNGPGRPLSKFVTTAI